MCGNFRQKLQNRPRVLLVRPFARLHHHAALRPHSLSTDKSLLYFMFRLCIDLCYVADLRGMMILDGVRVIAKVSSSMSVCVCVCVSARVQLFDI